MPTLRSPVPCGTVKSCKQCGRLVPMKIHRDLLRKNYCSRSCRSRAAARTQNRFLVNKPRNCARCDAGFIAVFARQKYCSRRCQRAAATMLFVVSKNSVDSHLKRLAGRPHRTDLAWEGLKALYEIQGGLCAISGARMTWIAGKGRKASHTNISIDRINPGGPYVLSNVQLVCRIVNVMRHNMTMPEFVGWCASIAGAQDALGQRKAG